MIIEAVFPVGVGVSKAPKDFGVTNYCLEMVAGLDPLELDVMVDEPVHTSFYHRVSLSEDPKLAEMNEWVLNEARGYCKVIGAAGLAHISECWVTDHGVGEHHQKHIHGNTHLSAVFYIEGEKGDSPLVLHKTDNMCPIRKMHSVSTPFNTDIFRYSPEKGQLIIFPSDTCHSVPTKRTHDLRLVMVYNINLRE